MAAGQVQLDDSTFRPLGAGPPAGPVAGGGPVALDDSSFVPLPAAGGPAGGEPPRMGRPGMPPPANPLAPSFTPGGQYQAPAGMPPLTAPAGPPMLTPQEAAELPPAQAPAPQLAPGMSRAQAEDYLNRISGRYRALAGQPAAPIGLPPAIPTQAAPLSEAEKAFNQGQNRYTLVPRTAAGVAGPVPLPAAAGANLAPAAPVRVAAPATPQELASRQPVEKDVSERGFVSPMGVEPSRMGADVAAAHQLTGAPVVSQETALAALLAEPGESPEQARAHAQRILAPGYRTAHPLATGATAGVADLISGFSSPENLYLMGGTAGLPGLVGKTMSGLFAAQAAHGAYGSAGEALRAFREGKNSEATQALTAMIGDVAVAALAGRHAAEGAPAAVLRRTVNVPEAARPALRAELDQLRQPAQAIGTTEGQTGRTVLQASPRPEVNQAAATAEHPAIRQGLEQAVAPVEGAELAGARPEKETERTQEKMEEGQSPRTMRDYSGFRVGVDSEAARDQAAAAIGQRFQIVERQDHWAQGDPETGFHSLTLQVREPGSPVTHEVQILPREVADQADSRHGLYEKARDGDQAAQRQLREENAADWTAFQTRAAAAARSAGAGAHRFGTTQANIPADTSASQGLDRMRAAIPDADLAGDGKDIGGNHVTVRYGIQAGADTSRIEQFLRGQAPFTARLGETEVFPPTPSSDGAAVLVARIEAPELERLNREIEQHGDFKPSDFADYKAHATIAYLDPAKAAQYAGRRDLVGQEFPVDRIAISEKGGGQREVPLEGQRAGMPAAASSAAESSRPWRTPSVNEPPATQRAAAGSQVSRTALPPSEVTRSTTPGSVKEGGTTTLGAIEPTSGRIIHQPPGTVEEQMARAQAAVPEFQAVLDDLARRFNARSSGVNLKTAQSVRDKVVTGRPPENLPDYIRARLVFDHFNDIRKATEAIRTMYGTHDVEEFLDPPRRGGYRAVHMQIHLPSGISAELQLLPREIADVQEQAHVHYMKWKIPNLAESERQAAEAEIARLFARAHADYTERVRGGEAHAGGVTGAGPMAVHEGRPGEAGGGGREGMAGGNAQPVEPPGARPEETRGAGGVQAPAPGKGGTVQRAQDLKPGDVGRVPLADLTLDAKRFQYKMNVGEKGTTNLLAGRKWNEKLAGIIMVWRDPADGQTYVVNGHHRYGLAEENGRPDIRVLLSDAPDAAHARADGALQNIAEGRGTAMDAAKFFRDTGMTEGDLANEGVSLREATAANGLALSRLDPSLFEQVLTGRLAEGRAIAIGSASADPAEQEAILKLITKAESRGKHVSNETVNELARMVRTAGQTTESQATLFGVQEMTRSLALEKAEISSYIRKEIANEQRTFAGVSTAAKAARLGAVEGQTIQAERNAEIAQQAAQAQELYDRLSVRSGNIDDILNASARQLAEGKVPSEVKREAYRQTRAALSEALTRPEAAQPPAAQAAAPRVPARRGEPAEQPAAGRPAGPAAGAAGAERGVAWKAGRQSTPVEVRGVDGQWHPGTLDHYNPGFNGAKAAGRVTLDDGTRIPNVPPEAMRLPREETAPAAQGGQWIGVDLDGTLAEYHGFKGKADIGAPIPAMVDRIKGLLDQGKDVRIFTARVADDPSGEARAAIEAWSEKYLGRRLPVTNIKDDKMAAIYDDRAIPVGRNTGAVDEQAQQQALAPVPPAGEPAAAAPRAAPAGVPRPTDWSGLNEEERAAKFRATRDQAKARSERENAAQAQPAAIDTAHGKMLALDPDAAVLWHRVFAKVKDAAGHNVLGAGHNWRAMNLGPRLVNMATYFLRERADQVVGEDPAAAAGYVRMARALEEARNDQGGASVLRGDYRDDTMSEEAFHAWWRHHRLNDSDAMRALSQHPIFGDTAGRLREMQYGLGPGREGENELAAEMAGKAYAGDPDLKLTPEQRQDIVRGFLAEAVRTEGREILNDLPAPDATMKPIIDDLKRGLDHGREYAQGVPAGQPQPPGGAVQPGGGGLREEGRPGEPRGPAGQPGTRGEPPRPGPPPSGQRRAPAPGELAPAFQRTRGRSLAGMLPDHLKPGLGEEPDTFVSANPIPPAGPRWTADRGAIPNEPFMYLDQDPETGEAPAAVIEVETPRGSLYEGRLADGTLIGAYGDVDRAAAATEYVVDHPDERALYQRGRPKPEPVRPEDSFNLPGMEGSDRARAAALAEEQGRRLTEAMRAPGRDISAAAGEMEREAPLFFGTGENPALFQNRFSEAYIGDLRRIAQRAHDEVSRLVQARDDASRQAQRTARNAADWRPVDDIRNELATAQGRAERADRAVTAAMRDNEQGVLFQHDYAQEKRPPEADKFPAGEPVARYQWKRNAEGGQRFGNQQAIYKLTPELFDQWVKPLLRPGFADSLEELQRKVPTDGYVSLLRQADGRVRIGGVGALEDVRPRPGPVTRGWVRPVDSFSSAEARAHGAQADSARPAVGQSERAGQGPTQAQGALFDDKGEYPALFQREQEDTPEFKSWFANSKVTDAEGAPRALYHVTPEDFTTFQTEPRPTGEGKRAADSVGAWFAGNQKFAGAVYDWYMSREGPGEDEVPAPPPAGFAPRTMPVYLAIEHPLELKTASGLDDTLARWAAGEITRRPGAGPEVPPGVPKYQLSPEQRENLFSVVHSKDFPLDLQWGNLEAVRNVKGMLRAAGYDGIHMADDGGLGDAWIAFDPGQVKSALGNRGTFSRTNPDILYQGDNGEWTPFQQTPIDIYERELDRPEPTRPLPPIETYGREFEATAGLPTGPVRFPEPGRPRAEMQQRLPLRGGPIRDRVAAMDDLISSLNRRAEAKPGETALDVIARTAGNEADKALARAGEFWGGVPGAVRKALSWTKATSAALARDWTASGLEQSDWKAAQKQLKLAENTTGLKVRQLLEPLNKLIRDEKLGTAAAIWAQADGDEAVLRRWANSAKLTNGKHNAAEYAAALKLPEELKPVVRDIQRSFDELGEIGERAGLLNLMRRNYVPHLLEPMDAARAERLIDASEVNPNPGFAKRRFYKDFFESELAGERFRTKDLRQLVAAHYAAFDQAMASREWIRSMLTGRDESDGRPIFVLKSKGPWIQVPDDQLPQIVNQGSRPDSLEGYRLVDRPQLRNFLFKPTEDDLLPYIDDPKLFKTGRENYGIKGDLLVHPNHIKAVENMLTPDWFHRGGFEPFFELARKGDITGIAQKAARGVQKVSSLVKEINTFGAPFHLATEAENAAEHWVNPFPGHIRDIDLNNEVDRLGAMHMNLYHYDREGLFGARTLHGLLHGFPGLSNVAEFVNKEADWLFEDYIPKIKMESFRRMYARNLKTYSDLTREQVAELTGKQVDATYGNINHTLDRMPRNKTFQSVARLTLFAPDFLEARARLVLGAFSRYGAQQRRALARGLLMLYVTPRIINASLNHGDPKWNWHDMFSVVVPKPRGPNGEDRGEWRFTIKTPFTEMLQLVSNPRMFASARENPLTVRPALKLLMGRDDYGRQMSATEQLKEFFKGTSPFLTQKALETPDESIQDSILSAFGAHLSNYRSPTEQKVHELYLANLPAGAEDEGKQAESRHNRQLEDKVRTGEMKPKEIWDEVDQGKLTAQDAARIVERANKSRLEIEFAALPLREAMKIYAAAPVAEKAQLHDELAQKRERGIDSLPVADRQRVSDQIDQLLAQGEKPATP